MSESATKRRRIDQRPPSPVYKLDDEENDDYVPYVPVAQRRQQKLAALSSHLSSDRQRARSHESPAAEEDEDDAEVRRRDKERNERTLLMEAQEVHAKQAVEGMFRFVMNLAAVNQHLLRRCTEDRDREGAGGRCEDLGRNCISEDACLGLGISKGHSVF